jgi:hypothetical protein
MAALRGRADMAAMLVASGADVDGKDHQGTTPLHAAAHRGHAACVSALLAGGADAVAVDAAGRTALYVASKRGASQCFKLLKAHADKMPKASLRSAVPVLHPNAEARAPAPRGGETAPPKTSQPPAPPSQQGALLPADAFFDLLRAGAALGPDLLQFSWADAQSEAPLQATSMEEVGGGQGEEDMLSAALREAAGLVVQQDDSEGVPDVGPGVEAGPAAAAKAPLSPAESSSRQLQSPGRMGAAGDASEEGEGDMAEQPPLDEIVLAPLADRWLDKADRPAREMLLSRLDRLARGRRSYALSKRLKNTRCAPRYHRVARKQRAATALPT